MDVISSLLLFIFLRTKLNSEQIEYAALDAFASLAVFKKASTVTPLNRRLKSHDFKVGILVIKVWRDNRNVAIWEILYLIS